jgi:beta-lactamase class A
MARLRRLFGEGTLGFGWGGKTVNRMRKVIAGSIVAALVAMTPGKTLGQTTAAETRAGNIEVLRQRLSELAASFPGKVGVFVRNVETGAEVALSADDQFPMASTYKVAIMAQVFREVEAGRMKLDERVTLTQADRRLGSGLLPLFDVGLNPTIHDLLLMMITVSDNEATDLLVKRVGAKNVTAMLRQLGIEAMRVDRSTEEIIGSWLEAGNPALHGVSGAEFVAHPEKFGGMTAEQTETADRAIVSDPRDHSSPRAMAELFTKIVRNQAASEKSCADMLGIMRGQQLRTRINRYLENVSIASKSGTIGYTTNDVGVLFLGKQHIVLSIFTLKGSSVVSTEQAEERIGRMARVVYEYFEDLGAGK